MGHWIEAFAQTRAERYRAQNRARQQAKRTQWRQAGRCVECGGERDRPYRQCLHCRIGDGMRQDRWRFNRQPASVPHE